MFRMVECLICKSSNNVWTGIGIGRNQDISNGVEDGGVGTKVIVGRQACGVGLGSSSYDSEWKEDAV